MDSSDISPSDYAHVLSGLAKVNRWTLASRPTLRFLRDAVSTKEAFNVLDVGFGQGDMLRLVAKWADKKGKQAKLTGVDLNPKSLATAKLAAENFAIDFRIGDYRELAGPFDCIISSLVAHHMGESELIDFIRYMETHATRGWLINDLHRHQIAYRGYPVLACLLRVHRIVREDGTLSIARAFRPLEWRAILAEAGVPPGAAKVVRRFPFRLCVERLR